MKIDPKNLPNDPALLHQIIGDLLAEVSSLKAQLALLKKKQFSSPSEKLEKQIAELELRVEEQEMSESPQATKQQPKRKPLPKDLPRDEVILPSPDVCPECNGTSFRKISDDISETLEYIPSSFKVIRHIRPRCACTNCEHIVQAEPASQPIDKGLAGAGLLAHILLQKYRYHLPFYRQSQMLEEQGMDISRSTMAHWAGKCSALLLPLVEEIRKDLFTSAYIHGDDTTVKVLAPTLGKTKTGRIWVYVRDGRPHGDESSPLSVCYYYSPDRKGERPASHLKGYKGTFHADAYPGYDKLYQDQDITEAACWAHMRRKFYEVTVVKDNATVAIEALKRIGKIYDLESSVRGSPAADRLKVRKEQTKALVDEFFIWLKKVQKKVAKKSDTARALQYALNHREALIRFLEDGRIEIDNNAAERAMRTVAVGRKNWLFAGSDKGGETLATMLTLIETAKMNGLNPFRYLREVLSRIQDHNSQKLHELLPWNITLPEK